MIYPYIIDCWMKEIAHGVAVSVEADPVLWPTVVYNPDKITGIYFLTPDDQHGRVTFEQLDALRICRGEYLPCKQEKDSKNPDAYYSWVFWVENSKWLTERYEYESAHYRSDYDWGGNVEEMLTDFSHFIFQFHDQFVEVIAKGFWIESSPKGLLNKPLLPGHPLLPLESEPSEVSLEGRLFDKRLNPLPLGTLISQSQFFTQNLITYTPHSGLAEQRPDFYLKLFRRGYALRGCFGRELATFTERPTTEQVESEIARYLKL